MVNTHKAVRNTVALCLLLAFCVTVLGGYVRLSDAGLGCPDWPGCYGQLLGVPATATEIATAEENYPSSEVDTSKAMKEMAHRYAAGALGLLLFVLAWFGWRAHRLTILLCGLVLFQAVLGMWTVTLLLKPAVVVAHLLGGMSIIAILTWLLASLTRPADFKHLSPSVTRFLSVFGVVVLVITFVQIALGGWVSANYAALACPDFPTCQSQWWPDNMDFSAAMSVWGKVGVNYEFGRLDSAARVAAHIMHRMGAIVLILVATTFLLSTIMKTAGALRALAGVALVILFVQAGLGVANVVYALPLEVATAHNATAAVLLMSITALVAWLKNIA